MTKDMATGPDSERDSMEAEFDRLAEEYHGLHAKNVALTGEEPEYFAEYKINDLDRFTRAQGLGRATILDFGSGIGNSIPFFDKYFPESKVTAADVSLKSIEFARKRFPEHESYLHIVGDRLGLPDASQDIVFSACVFHHIPPEQHDQWLRELLRVTRPGGILAIYEHNPNNPLTVRAVDTCPLDENAILISGREFRRRSMAAGWSSARIGYKLFFPAALAFFRKLEVSMEWIPIGAQYRLSARKL